MCALALDVALWEFGSIRAAVRELSDPGTWNRLREKTEQAWPDCPRRRLPERPISRSQYHRARRRHTLPRLAEIKAWAETTSAEAARWIEMLDPRTAKCVTRLWPGNVIAGDTTYMKALSGADPANPGLRLDPDTGELTLRRFDPDARPYHTHTGSGVGHRCLILSTRHGPPGERIIYCIGPIGPGSDATAFTDTVLRLQQDQPAFAAGAAAAVYDGALHAGDMIRLQNNAIIPIAKTHRTNRKYATANLGRPKATLPGGTRRRVAVTAIDGTPTIAATDADGELWHIPLIRTKTRVRRNKRRPASIDTRWRVPRHPLAGPLAGATLGIRHTPPQQPQKDPRNQPGAAGHPPIRQILRPPLRAARRRRINQQPPQRTPPPRPRPHHRRRPPPTQPHRLPNPHPHHRPHQLATTHQRRPHPLVRATPSPLTSPPFPKPGPRAPSRAPEPANPRPASTNRHRSANITPETPTRRPKPAPDPNPTTNARRKARQPRPRSSVDRASVS